MESRTFIEKKIHDGQIRDKAMLQGKDLPVWLFQFQVLKNGIRTFRMDYSPVIPAVNAGIAGREFFREFQLGGNPRLLQEEAEQVNVQVKQIFMSLFQNGKKFVTIIVEPGGRFVGGNDGPFHPQQPRLRPVNPQLPDRQRISSVFMHDGNRQCFYTSCRIDAAPVAI